GVMPSPAPASNSDPNSSLQQYNNLLAAMGTTAQQAAQETSHAFATIGSMAEQQIGQMAAGMFDAYANAMAKAIQTGEFSATALGAAGRKVLANALRTIGEEATVKAAMQIAEGVAAIAGIGTATDAPMHFEAAALYLGV